MQKKFIFAVLGAIVLANTNATAQAVFDMTMITCKQYLALDRDRQDIMASWFSGV